MGNRIRELREEKKWTQTRLSTELELAQETVSGYERNTGYPSVDVLLKMVELFDASMDYIMGLSDIRKPALQSSLTGDEGELIVLYRRLRDTQKEKALAFLQGMLA